MKALGQLILLFPNSADDAAANHQVESENGNHKEQTESNGQALHEKVALSGSTLAGGIVVPPRKGTHFTAAIGLQNNDGDKSDGTDDQDDRKENHRERHIITPPFFSNRLLHTRTL